MDRSQWTERADIVDGIGFTDDGTLYFGGAGTFMMSTAVSPIAPVVIPKPGQSIDLADIQAFLKSQKVAIQYIPERLLVRDDIPSTPSGKIQKFKLREMLQHDPS